MARKKVFSAPSIMKATFAAGCFWGVEYVFSRVNGVVSTIAGYTGGDEKRFPNPTYEDVCSDKTGYAESVQLEYDPKKVSYNELLNVFWSIHDPTSVNRQGPDFGSQYRSAIFYHDEEQKRKAQSSIKTKSAGSRIVTEIKPAKKFFPAEEYHQKYYEKNDVAACNIMPYKN